MRGAVGAVLETLGKKAGPEDDRPEEKRFHDTLQLACALRPSAGPFVLLVSVLGLSGVLLASELVLTA